MFISTIRRRAIYAIGCTAMLAMLLPWRSVAEGMSGMPGMSMMQHQQASSCDSTQPLGCADSASATFAPDGTLLLVWTQERKIYFARSKDFGQSWTLPLKIGDAGSGFDGGGDARPQLAADAKGRVLVAYDTFKDQHWNAEIWLASSSDGGAHFDTPRVFEPDGVSQRLPVLDVAASGEILMAWQDKRLSGPRNLPGASIAYAWSEDGGRTFSASALAADTSCECCRIGITNAGNQSPILAFRTIFPGEVRDHVILPFSSSRLPGQPQRVSVDDWAVDACPHQGPSIAVSASGTLHVTWYTQGKVRQGLFYARSTDHGRHFSEPQQLGNADDATSRPYVFAQGNRVWRVWKAFDGRVSSVVIQYSHNEGRDWNAPRTVDSAAGHSDHPLLIGYRKRVFLSWLSREHGYQLIELKDAR